MKSRITKYIIIFIILLGGVVMGIICFHEHKYKDLISYEENLLGIEFRDYVDGVEGDIERSFFDEEYANIRFEIKAGYEEEMIEAFKGKYSCFPDIASYSMPGYQNHELAIEMKSRNIKYIFISLKAGKYAMTRSTEIYIVEDENNKMYVYIFG